MSVSRLAGALARGITHVTGGALGPYQSAVVRIGFSFTWLVFLLREWPHRRELYGPDGPWSWDMARQLIDGNGAFTVLMWSDGRLWFETVYLLSVAASALLLLGWRTRTVSVLFMVGVLSLQNRSVFMGDGGDNVIHLMAIYLVLTRCGRVWSLDARRERRRRRARESGFAGGKA
ncbi:HTTM domain-containing protein, partial [Streptomyces sp. SID5475]|nr:HTTM domain-containing protein [Streptomyces sp. SID5475]